jgi:hypothetical protein
VSNCSFTATQNGATSAGISFAATSAGGRAVTVDQDGGPVAFHLQVIC